MPFGCFKTERFIRKSISEFDLNENERNVKHINCFERRIVSVSSEAGKATWKCPFVISKRQQKTQRTRKSFALHVNKTLQGLFISRIKQAR